MIRQNILRLGLIAFAISSSFGQAAYAQTQAERKNVQTDWSVFAEDSPKRCWVVSSPKKSVNTKNGRPVSVKRGTILLFVSFFPEQKSLGEVSFTGGYPFAADKTVSLKIGSSNFELFTAKPKSETAWAATSTEDRKIITAMKRGIEAVIVGLSERGTTTTDNFSLLGFTDAVEEAERLCTG